MKSKMKFLSWMFLSILFVVSNTSCSSDDDDDKVSDNAAVIAGTYNGDLFAVEADGPNTLFQSDVVIKVERKDANNIIFKVDIDLTALQLGVQHVTCPAVVTKDGDQYHATGKTSLEIPLPEGKLPLEVNITSDFKGKDATVNIKTSLGANFQFIGAKK